MKQITQTEKIRLFHLYHNAKVDYNGERHFMNTIGGRWLEIEQCGTNFNFTLPIASCQLLLYQLPDITDEDAKYICDMYGYASEMWGKLLSFSLIGTMAHFEFENHIVKITLSIHSYDFLRSKSYLLPFLNFTTEQILESGCVKIVKND